MTDACPYITTSKLGEGGFGAVYRAERIVQSTKIPQIVAIKLADISTLNLIEIDVMSRLQHPNLNRVFEFLGNDVCIPISQHQYGLVMPLANYDLTTLLKASYYITPELTTIIITQLLSALMFMHENLLLHLDIKPGNVLVFGEISNPRSVKVQLSDFGLTRLLERFDKPYVAKNIFGTPIYWAPEIRRITHNCPMTPAVDCWAMGVTILALLRKVPYPFQLMGDTYMLEYPIGNVPFSDIVNGLLNPDPRVRISSFDAVNLLQTNYNIQNIPRGIVLYTKEKQVDKTPILSLTYIHQLFGDALSRVAVGTYFRFVDLFHRTITYCTGIDHGLTFTLPGRTLRLLTLRAYVATLLFGAWQIYPTQNLDLKDILPGYPGGEFAHDSLSYGILGLISGLFGRVLTWTLADKASSLAELQTWSETIIFSTQDYITFVSSNNQIAHVVDQAVLMGVLPHYISQIESDIVVMDQQAVMSNKYVRDQLSRVGADCGYVPELDLSREIYVMINTRDTVKNLAQGLEIEGFLSLHIYRTLDLMEIYDVCVSTSYRKQKRASKMIQTAINLSPVKNMWIGVNTNLPLFERTVRLYYELGFKHTSVTNTSLSGRSFPFTILGMTFSGDYEPDTLYTILGTLQQNIKELSTCKTPVFIDTADLKYLYESLMTQENEVSGGFSLEYLPDRPNVLTASLDKENLVVGGEVEVLPAIAKYRLSFHTHPFAAYPKYNICVAWPSEADLVASIHYLTSGQFINMVICSEGIYSIQIHGTFIQHYLNINQGCRSIMQDNMRQVVREQTSMCFKKKNLTAQQWTEEISLYLQFVNNIKVKNVFNPKNPNLVIHPKCIAGIDPETLIYMVDYVPIGDLVTSQTYLRSFIFPRDPCPALPGK